MYYYFVVLFFISSVVFADNHLFSKELAELQFTVQKIKVDIADMKDKLICLSDSLQDTLSKIAIHHLSVIKEVKKDDVDASTFDKRVAPVILQSESILKNSKELISSSSSQTIIPYDTAPAAFNDSEGNKKDKPVYNREVVMPNVDEHRNEEKTFQQEEMSFYVDNKDAIEETKAQQDGFFVNLYDTDLTVLEVYNDPQILYDQALNLMHQGQIMEAISGFKYFIQKFSNHELLPHVYFWLGNSYYISHEYPAALHSFTYYLQRWPRHEKAPTILLNLFHIYTVLGEHTKAKNCMQRLLDDYPHARETELAKIQASRNG